MIQLKCENICLGYDGKEILHDISFEVCSGDFLCILGENGSGKSTLMKTILGILPPINGKIYSKDGLCQSEIGYLPQQSLIQKDFPATVKEIVMSGFIGSKPFKKLYSKENLKTARQNMEKMGILPIQNKSYKELSGGQQQRVLLSRALCATKKMLLLDEPVAGLDPIVTVEMYRLIKKLNDEGITIIMISHDIEAAIQYSNKILHIGNEIFFGSKHLYQHTKIHKDFCCKEDDL